MTDDASNVVRLADPLILCLGHLAERFGTAFAPAMFKSLARDPGGSLPLHQVEPATEILGLNCDISRSGKLSRKPAAYPVIAAFENGTLAVIDEVREGDALVWRPGEAEARWEPIADLETSFAGWAAGVFGDPTSIRDAGSPWDVRAKGHWFWSELYRLRREFWPVLMASLIVNMLALALPLFTMNVYDRVLPNRAQATLWVLAIGVVIAFGFDFALRRARSRVLDDLGRDLDLKLSQKIFSKILASPLAVRKGHTGNLVARVSEFSIVRDFFASTTIVLIVDLAFLVLFLAAIAYIAGWLVMVPIVIAILMFIQGIRLQRKVARAAREAQTDYGLQQTLLVESIAGLETLKSIGGEGVILGRWRRLAELGSRSQQQMRDISAAAVSLASTFQQMSSIGLIIGGYYLFASGQITMGAIIAIVMISSRSLAPVSQLAILLTRMQQARQVLESLQGLWEQEDERKMGSGSLTPNVRTANIQLDNLDFTYPDMETPSLSGINLSIEPGDKIAIIGRVAAGKSTLGRVLCGLYEPTGGALLVDGLDSRQYRPQDLRSAFRFVGQDAELFTGTIKDNLILGADMVRDEDLLDALRNVGADQFLSRDAGGFDRQVGESGVRLSGGQRSFLTLARALVTPCKLLFLDEPTGAMDSQTEKLFVERLSQSLTPDQTLIISTHRPALLGVCDRLVVLDKGRIIADGPRDQVVASAGVQMKA